MWRILEYKEFLKNMVKKDLKIRYKNSILGFLWSFINPLLQLLIYGTVFYFFMRSKLEYYFIYVFIGLLPWNYFISSTLFGTQSLIAYTGLITKVYFPREIIPLSIIIGGLINMLFGLIILLFFMLIITPLIKIKLLLFLPLFFLLQGIMCFGISAFFSALNVIYRDVEYILTNLLQALFYATPILYTVDIFPEKYRWILYLNPMTSIVNLYRSVLYYGEIPTKIDFIVFFIYSLFLGILGYYLFLKLDRGLIEKL